MKKLFILFILFFFLFGCIEQPKESLNLSEIEIGMEQGKVELQNAERIGIIMVKDNISQENWVKVIECAVGYSRSLGEKNKTIVSYGIEYEICLNDELGETTLGGCSEHIKENTDYSIYLIGGEKAETIFYEDNMKVVVPENNIIECGVK
jgi:hypothetical protein